MGSLGLPVNNQQDYVNHDNISESPLEIVTQRCWHLSLSSGTKLTLKLPQNGDLNPSN